MPFIMLIKLQGQLKYCETVTEGFDKMFDAFLDLFTGKHFGKAVIKAKSFGICHVAMYT